MTKTSYAGICMAYIRKAGSQDFFPVNFTLDTDAAKTTVKGNLAPGRSGRASTVLINPGASSLKVISALKTISAYIKESKLGAVEAISIGFGAKSKPDLLKVTLTVDAAPALVIANHDELLKPASAVPGVLVFVPATLRRWQDLYDDVQSLTETIKDYGLFRGVIETKLGSLEIGDNGEGIWAHVAKLPGSGRYRFRRPLTSVVDDRYFALEDADDEEEEEEEEEEEDGE